MFHSFGRQKHQQAFVQLRDAFCSAPILAFPDFEKPFIVDTDACSSDIGAVLFQLDSDNVEHPVVFISRSLSPAEHNYTVTRLKLLAVAWACQTLRPYLLCQKFLLLIMVVCAG